MVNFLFVFITCPSMVPVSRIHLFVPPLLLCAVLAIGSVSALGDNTAMATRLTPQNIASLQPGGPDAIAGLGDWVLSNGVLCAAISDIGHETGLNAWGGALVDVYHCERDDDQWPFHHLLPNLDKDQPLKPTHIEAVQSAQMAEIIVTSSGDGLELTSRYQVRPSQPTLMVIEHELVRRKPGKPLTLFGSMVLHTHLSLTPYALATKAVQHSQGFNHESWDRSDIVSTVAAMTPGDTHILVGSHELSPVSYGLQLGEARLIDRDGVAVPLPKYLLTHPTFSIQGVMTRRPWLGGDGKLGLLEFAQSTLMDIEPGETVQLQQRVILGSRADVSSVTDQIYRGMRLAGSVDTSNAVVHVSDRQGVPLTNVRPEADGSFQLRVPLASADSVNLSLRTPWGSSAAALGSAVDGQFSSQLSTGTQPSFVELPKAGPMRLIFLGLEGTANPDFHDDLMGFQLDGKPHSELQSANYISLAGIASDPDTIALAAGKYRVIASRGMLYSVTETEITVPPGATVKVEIEPPMRELLADNWLAGDFHVHSAPSFDSTISVDERLRSFVAQGSDVLVATEHNVIVNYHRDVQRMGLSAALKVINGTELTGMARTPSMPFTNGHLNIFPVTANDQQFSGGLFPHEGKRLRSLYDDARKHFGAVLLQLNHPRLADELDPEGDGTYFEHLDKGTIYDPDQPLDSQDNRSLIEPDPLSGIRDLDFDLMEIANGDSYESYQSVRRDWFSLLQQGEKIVGSANSDSHGSSYLVAIPQNFVQMSGQYSENAFIEAVRAGKVVGSTGPLLEVYAQTAEHKKVELGQTVQGSEFTLHIKVDAASWVPVDQLTVYLDGQVYHRQSIERGQELQLPVSTDSNGFVIVEVNASPDDLYSTVVPGFTPFAFSNPIYINTSGD